MLKVGKGNPPGQGPRGSDRSAELSARQGSSASRAFNSGWGEDEPQTLCYAIMPNCSMSADRGHMRLEFILRKIGPHRDSLPHDRPPLWIVADPPWHIDAVGARSHHVWVAPVLAGCRLGWHHTVECVHVSGLLSERYAPWPVWDPRVVVKTSKRARSSPCDTGFPNPDLSDRFHTSFSFSRIFETVLLTSSVRHQRSPRNSSFFVIMAHSILAILFASAMAASIRGLRARIRPNQELSAGAGSWCQRLRPSRQ